MNKSLLRAAAYAAASAFLVLAVWTWLRPSPLSPSAPDVLADAARPDPLPPDAQAPAAEHSVAHAPGEPVDPDVRQADRAAMAASSAPSLTNEQLHAALEQEKAHMGIKRIVPPRRAEDGSAAIPVPVPASAPALPGATPQLLSQAPASGSAPSPTPSGAALAAAAAPPEVPSAPGLIIHSEAERAALWAARHMAAAPPTVDYSRQRLAVVFSEGPSFGVEVAAVQTFPDRVVVQYREPEIPADAERQTQAPAYQFRVLPLTDKPVIFQKLP